MATQAATKKRADGPVKITYLDAAGKSHDRVPANVASVNVLDRSANKSTVYKLDDLSDEILCQLAAQGFGKRADITARNAVKADPKASVTTVTSELWSNLKSGKFSTRGEGKGGPGRTFDFDMWREVWENAWNVKNKNKDPKCPTPWTDKHTAKLQAKFDSFTPADRNKYINTQIKNDPILALERNAQKQRALKEAAKEKKVNDSFADFL